MEKSKLQKTDKTHRKNVSTRTIQTRYTKNSNKCQPTDEMKSIMKEWHKPVYHKSSFSISPDLTSEVAKREENETMCRICQSLDDSVQNQQVTPCGCSGSLLYVHMDCLRQWRLTQRAKGFDVSICELCKKPYNIQLLGDTNVKTDALIKMQEDLKKLIRSGIYLMLLVKSWKQDMAHIHESQTSSTNLANINEQAIPLLTNNSHLLPSQRSRGVLNSSTDMEYLSNNPVHKTVRISSRPVNPSLQSRELIQRPSSESSSSDDAAIDHVTRDAIKRRNEKARMRRRMQRGENLHKLQNCQLDS